VEEEANEQATKAALDPAFTQHIIADRFDLRYNRIKE
jgi:hypothetical protein